MESLFFARYFFVAALVLLVAALVYARVFRKSR